MEHCRRVKDIVGHIVRQARGQWDSLEHCGTVKDIMEQWMTLWDSGEYCGTVQNTVQYSAGDLIGHTHTFH